MRPHILISSAMPKPSAAANYEAAVLAADGLFTTRYTPDADLSFDGLLLTGGGDIDPCHYGQTMCGSTEPAPQRDRAELALCRAYLRAGKPILGVCRGHQIINVALGGTMIQDLGQSLNAVHRSEGSQDNVHLIAARPGSILHQLYGPSFGVNSSHHQAVGNLGKGLVVTAYAPSLVIESLELPGKPVLGVQFHPERMTSTYRNPDAYVDGSEIFRWFIAQCR